MDYSEWNEGEVYVYLGVDAAVESPTLDCVDFFANATDRKEATWR